MKKMVKINRAEKEKKLQIRTKNDTNCGAAAAPTNHQDNIYSGPINPIAQGSFVKVSVLSTNHSFVASLFLTVVLQFIHSQRG